MRHQYACHLRWADMDLLGHVNNVRYLDYLAAAREAAFEGLPAGRAPVLSHRVEFVAPLVFHRDPVDVETWVSEVADGTVSLAHEVYDEAGAERRVHLRASTVLAARLGDDELTRVQTMHGPDHEWRELAHPARPPRSTFEVQVRRADLDQVGHVSDAVLFEYLQESRINYVMGLHTRGQAWTQHVIARTDVRMLRPMPMRRTPYTVSSWVGELGTKSFTICAEVRDDDIVLAEATVVMVTFDQQTQRPAPMADSQRERLQAELEERPAQ